MADGPVIQLRSNQGTDSINLPVVPIVFVPGVMGSRLSMPGGTDWDPDDVFAMLSWAGADVSQRQRDLSIFDRPNAPPLRTFASTVEFQVKTDQALNDIAARTAPGQDAVGLYQDRGWPGAVGSFYLPILRLLEIVMNRTFIQQPMNPVYCYGYDWRQSNTASGAGLLARIRSILAQTSGAKRVVVISHSMGGLVTRSAILQGATPLIGSVIHTVLPSNGAVVAYRRFQTGAISPIDGTQLPDRVLQAIMGATRADYAQVQSGLAGPVQLLPNHIYQTADKSPWLRTSPQVDLGNIYATYALLQEPGIVPPVEMYPGMTGPFIQARLRAVVDTARRFHSSLGNTFHPRTFVMFSDGLMTDVAYDGTQTDLNLKVVRRAAGDGTVPTDSGSCPGIGPDVLVNRAGFTNLAHAAVFADSMFDSAVIERARVALAQAMFSR